MLLLLRKIQMHANHPEGKIGASQPFNLFPLQTHLLQPLFNTLKLQRRGKMSPWDYHVQWILQTWNTILLLEREIPSDLMNLWAVTKIAGELYLWGPLFDWERSRKRKKTIGHKTPLYFPLIIRLHCGLVTLIGFQVLAANFHLVKLPLMVKQMAIGPSELYFGEGTVMLTTYFPTLYVSFLFLDFSCSEVKFICVTCMP